MPIQQHQPLKGISNTGLSVVHEPEGNAPAAVVEYVFFSPFLPLNDPTNSSKYCHCPWSPGPSFHNMGLQQTVSAAAGISASATRQEEGFFALHDLRTSAKIFPG
jgi:hypothetical protein